jgi:hypothetical protein
MWKVFPCGNKNKITARPPAGKTTARESFFWEKVHLLTLNKNFYFYYQVQANKYELSRGLPLGRKLSQFFGRDKPRLWAGKTTARESFFWENILYFLKLKNNFNQDTQIKGLFV